MQTVTYKRLQDFVMKQVALDSFLNSDDILKISDDELILLENMNECLMAYVKILKKKWADEELAREQITKIEVKHD